MPKGPILLLLLEFPVGSSKVGSNHLLQLIFNSTNTIEIFNLREIFSKMHK